MSAGCEVKAEPAITFKASFRIVGTSRGILPPRHVQSGHQPDERHDEATGKERALARQFVDEFSHRPVLGRYARANASNIAVAPMTNIMFAVAPIAKA